MLMRPGLDLTEEISRVVGGHSGPKKDFYSATHTSTFKVSGRHILNVWRICRSEITLNQYSFENVVFHLLHQRSALGRSLARTGGLTLQGPAVLGSESDCSLEKQDTRAYESSPQVLLPARGHIHGDRGRCRDHHQECVRGTAA